MVEFVMAVAGSVTALIGCARFVCDTGAAFYDAKVEWDQFPAEVDRLTEIVRKDWQRNVDELGLEWCQDRLITPLKKANELLEREQTELIKRKKEKEVKSKGILNKMKTKRIAKRMIFPSEIGRSINEVIKAFEDIQKGLKSRQEVRAMMEMEALDRPSSADFTQDGRYVSLTQTEQTVQEALKSSLKLVLLYGQLGQGKSTLAREIALQIGYPSWSSATNDPPLAADSVKSPVKLSETFEEVVFLECGPDCDSLEVEMELRQKLGWTSADRYRFTDQKRLLKGDVDRSLEGLLQNRKVLIILDDVWDCSLIRDMLRPTRKFPTVKFLVTSQVPDLCKGFNLEYRQRNIEVEQVNLAVARQVLIHHIPHIDISAANSLSKEIQERCDRIIEMVDRNLLAVACVGGAFSNKADFQDPDTWKEVEADLEGWLNQANRTFIHDKCYSRGSYYSALKFSICQLMPDEKRLLIFIILANIYSPQDPDAARRWYSMLGDDRMGFQPYLSARRTLEVRQFVRRSTMGIDLVLGPLQHFFTKRIGGEHKDSTLRALSKLRISQPTLSPRNKAFLSILCSFYSEEAEFFTRIAMKLKRELKSANLLITNGAAIDGAHGIEEIQT